MIGLNNLKIENVNLPDGFTFSETVYSGRVKIKTNYIYFSDQHFIDLYLAQNDEQKWTITDYGDFIQSFDHHLLPPNDDLFLKVLDERKIGYEVRVQYFDDVVVKELQYINHVVQNDADLNSDLLKIAKTLSELTNEFRH